MQLAHHNSIIQSYCAYSIDKNQCFQSGTSSQPEIASQTWLASWAICLDLAHARELISTAHWYRPSASALCNL